MRYRDFLENHSAGRLFTAGALLAGIAYAVYINPKDTSYFDAVEKEIVVAMRLCEESEDWLYTSTDHLKMDKNVLNQVLLDGQKVHFKHLKHPEVLLFSQGFEHTRETDELFCSFKDPRSGRAFYYSYKHKRWEERSRTRL